VNPGLALRRQERESNLKQAAQAAVALLLVGLGWTVWDGADSEGRRDLTSVSYSLPSQEVYSPETLERINRHMQFTEKKTELRALAVEIENFELGSSLRPGEFGTSPTLYPYSAVRDFDSENYPERVYRDIYPSEGRYDDPVLPADRIASMIEQDRWLNKYEAEQRKAFVEAVKENARAAGYELEINDQLQVVKVQRRPNSLQGSAPEQNLTLGQAKPGAAQ